MRMSIEEFKVRLEDIDTLDAPVAIFDGQGVLGHYLPIKKHEVASRLAVTADDAARIHAWSDKRAEMRDSWKANTPDWEKRMADYGLTPDGDPIES